MKRSVGAFGLAAAGLLSACGGGGGESSADTDYPPAQAIEAPVLERAPADARGDRLAGRLRAARGPVEVWVSLEQPSLAAKQATLAAAAGLSGSREAVQASSGIRKALADHRQAVTAQQADVGSALSRLGATELGRVSLAHNAIAVRVDASRLAQVAAIGGVAQVRPVVTYRRALSATVPYVGAAGLHTGGLDGRGVRVAVFDSGIDYTHRNLGGAGTAEAYAAAYGSDVADPLNRTRDGLFPTAKVVDGYDFVGEDWPYGDRTEDADPIDRDGHGTHVADIVAGRSADGAHRGMAPGASLVAVKVCSAVAPSCDGVAILRGFDYALDPNGDGDLADAVDVINLSLASSYGQEQDDAALAAANAVRAGVVVVAAAGNSADLPYTVGAPSTAPGVISVAQTQPPLARIQPLTINAPASVAGVYPDTATLPYAPVGAGAGGDVVALGRGCPAGTAGESSTDDAYPADPAGRIALIDAGAEVDCAVSLKIDRAAKAGAVGVLIAPAASGVQVRADDGGADSFVPALLIPYGLAERIRAALAVSAVNLSFSEASSLPGVVGVVGTSARGPAYSSQHIKPEIGAPGSSVSADAGSGTGESAFSGTSGATPVVAGAAALLRQQHPGFSPERIKALLMNSAETAVYSDPERLPGQLAPVTRTGAGELRVGRAAALSSLVWERNSSSAALSFGAVEVDRRIVLQRSLRVENFGSTPRVFRITASFRDPADRASGAVRLFAPDSVSVAPGEPVDVTVSLSIDPRRLPAWPLNGGGFGGRGDLLDQPEFDGHLNFTDGSERLSVPWHVLPRRAARAVALAPYTLDDGLRLPIVNQGAADADFEVFSQTGSSPRQPSAELPQPGDNFAVVDLKAVGVRFRSEAESGVGGGLIEFAIATHGRRAHPNYPASFDIDVDVNGDGFPDFAVYNSEYGGFAASGQNVVAVTHLSSGETNAYYFTDADLNSGNLILVAPAASLGIGPDTTFGFSVYAFDNYFTGALTDSIEGMRFTAGRARYEVVGEPYGRVPGRASAAVPVRANDVPSTDSSETGLLLLYRRNAGQESSSVSLP